MKDKVAKRKAKVKAKKRQIETDRIGLAPRLASSLERLCAPVLPEYIDDSNGIDLVGRRIVYQMGFIAWNIAVTGRKDLSQDAFAGSQLNVEQQAMVQNEIVGLVKRKYAEFSTMRTGIREFSVSLVNGEAKVKVKLGDTFPELPIPDFAEPEVEEDNISIIAKQLLDAGNPEKSLGMQRFFKTAPGEYGEGDQFIGLTSPQIRGFAKEYRDLTLTDLSKLLNQPYHEMRSLALAILVEQYRKADDSMREKIFQFYLAQTSHINNWDLVDISAPGIVGEYLLTHERTILDKLAASSLLWEQRIAVVSTLTLIRHGEFADTFRLVKELLKHPHDLMHKACGWMLREVGKRDRAVLTAFLMKHKSSMPRTMLRYAIEHYPEAQRKEFLLK